MEEWRLNLEICVEFLDFGNVQCILGFAQLPRLCRTCTHIHTYIHVQAHTCAGGREVTVIDMDLPLIHQPTDSGGL